VCDDGTLNVNLLKNEVFWNETLIFESDQKISRTYFDQMLFYTNDILTRKTSFNSVNEAYEILKICLAEE